MTERMIRRDKSDKCMTEVRLFGPFNDDLDGAKGPGLKLDFTDRKITEVQEGGNVVTLIRSVALADLEAGKRYLLTWRMLGEEGAEVEFLLDKRDNPVGASFESIAKDKLPAAGTDFVHSRQTKTGLLWENSKRVKG